MSVRLDESLDDYQEEIAELKLALFANPQKTEAMRDLGAIYMRTGHAVEANRLLQDAFSGGDRSPKLQFFLGLSNEALGKTQTALRIYEGYADLSRISPYRRLMAGRYAVLIRESARDELRKRLSDEANISDNDISNSLLAVFSLKYQGSDERYVPLGRGLAEMVTIDLQNVDQLRVVERVRLQALMDELKLSQSQMFDASTSPRLGRLLRAGRIVGGTYYVLSDNTLRLDAAVLQTTSPEPRFLPSRSDNLDDFFRVEKRMVFDLLNELDIELTEAEIDRIQRVPTRNLQAFLAFSRGLLSEDRGEYGAAMNYFNQATEIDPQFSAAASRSERTGSMSSAATSKDLLEEAIDLEPLGFETFNPVLDRLDNLGIGVQSPILSRPDRRRPAVQSGLDVSAILRDPPPPPGGN